MVLSVLRLFSHTINNSISSISFRCPIVSLHHVPPSATDHFQGRGGLLTGTLEGASFWQDTGSQENEGPSLISNFTPVILPLPPGSCAGLHYCPQPQCFLSTYRPSMLFSFSGRFTIFRWSSLILLFHEKAEK